MTHIKLPVYTENEGTGIIQPSFDLEDDDDLIIYPNLTTNQNRQYTVLNNSFLEQQCTLKKKEATLLPHCYIKSINPASIRHLLDTSHDHGIQYVKTILKMLKSEESNENIGSRLLRIPMFKLNIHQYRNVCCKSW